MTMISPPGYPHMPPMSSAGPTMTGEQTFHVSWKSPYSGFLAQHSSCLLCVLFPGHHAQMNQQHMIPTRNFQMHRMQADDIQDDFDWDSIV